MTTTATAPARIVDLSSSSTLHGYEAIAAAIGLRSIRTITEELPGVARAAPILRAASIAVIANPWAGTSVTHDLEPETQRIAPVLAKLLTDRLTDVLGGPDAVQAFGKAAVVGLDGEIEHAGALIHTPYFGNLMREALEGTSILCFSDARSAAGSSHRIPLWHKTAPATRDFYQSLEVHLADAPHPGELAVIAAASTGPRPHARIGDRSTDRVITSDILKELPL
ncbi:amino acid synthesis family protein [Agrococcus sp. Marseille-Q4369]|uniref:amino acid synthesis family protein n=1 Tax=Agrococcus sp. Marseille-Q4369 TaxID=2810513 RepID=UPI001B8B71E7|nr:amino acid synthesis family protein [Agrococcus sp. Marseille-Q4369]QUW17815.1 amino acid synthesis family protein [Agrococcus sp. Marseille-Q4369]